MLKTLFVATTKYAPMYRILPVIIIWLYANFLLSNNFVVVDATDIRWTSNSDAASKSQAATAPKSQRYWDKHGIERPDYAKTDAEIAKERGELLSSPWITWLGFGLVAGLALGFYVRYYVLPIQEQQGSKLGGEVFTPGNQQPFSFFSSIASNQTSNGTPIVHDDDKIRKARLARFNIRSDDNKNE